MISSQTSKKVSTFLVVSVVCWIISEIALKMTGFYR